MLTFVGETRVLAISAEDELDEAEIPGFESNAQVGRMQSFAGVQLSFWAFYSVCGHGGCLENGAEVFRLDCNVTSLPLSRSEGRLDCAVLRRTGFPVSLGSGVGPSSMCRVERSQCPARLQCAAEVRESMWSWP